MGNFSICSKRKAIGEGIGRETSGRTSPGN